MAYTNYYRNSSLFHASLLGYMGTRIDLLLVGKDEGKLNAVWNVIERRIIKLDLLMSRYNSKGELFNVNAKASGCPVVVSDELWEILTQCLKYRDLTNGYFDVTLGYSNDLELSDQDHSVRFQSREIALDLGGYGKGYALMAIKDILRSNEIDDALINFGNSSILGLGNQPYGDGWSVAVANPYTGEILNNFILKNSSLTTSGNSPAHPAHILNPYTGVLERARKVAAIETVDAVEGEVLSTSALLMDSVDFQGILPSFNVTDVLIMNL